MTIIFTTLFVEVIAQLTLMILVICIVLLILSIRIIMLIMRSTASLRITLYRDDHAHRACQAYHNYQSSREHRTYRTCYA